MEQLQKALGKREEARAWLTNLREIAERGGAKDETTPALFREYRQRFEQANEEVSSIRENLRSELAVLETQFEAYEGQMKKLYSSATEAGTISPDEYTKELERITKEKSEVRERIAYVQQLIEADRPDDLAKVAVASSGGKKFDTALKPSARDKGHIALRIIQGVAGLLIVAGAFLPSFKNPGEGTLSLYPGVEPTASGEVLVFGKQVSLSSFLWLVPVALGLAISVAALIPSRSWRGGFTLLLTAILLLVIVTSLVIMLAYPRAGPLEEKLGAVIKGVFALNVWPVLVCFVVGTLMAYILCFLNLLSSKVGIVLWALSLVFFVSFGVGLGSYFKTALKPQPIVQLAWDNPVGYEQNLTVIVENRGNLPLEVIRPHTVTNPFEILTKKKSKPEKYQYALVLERQSSGDTWEKVDTLIFPGGGYGESSGGLRRSRCNKGFWKKGEASRRKAYLPRSAYWRGRC